MNTHLIRVLDTTLALCEEFTSSLHDNTNTQTANGNTGDNQTPSPLSLLSASATLLKSQVSKASLLAINTPFTPSAIISTLSAINDSILPSLLTAALLVDAERYTSAFATETRALVGNALCELQSLVSEIKNIALGDRGREGGVDEAVKSAVTTATGRVWGACEKIVGVAADGVVGLVIWRAREYLALVRDGIEELREWDPAEDEVGGEDEFGFEDEDEGGDNEGENEVDEEQCTKLRAQKTHILRVLDPVAKAYTAMITHRLKSLSADSSLTVSAISPRLDELLGCLRDIPDLTDEAAGSLYESKIPDAVEYTDKVLDRAINAVTITRGLIDVQEESAQSDKFSKWSTVWLNVVQDVRKSRPGEGTDKTSQV